MNLLKRNLKEKAMTHINHNLKVRRKNMRCAKTKYDMTKAFVDTFKETIEDNKRMKDALILFSHYLNGNFEWTIPLDCNDDMVNELINNIGTKIRKLKEKCNGKSE